MGCSYSVINNDDVIRAGVVVSVKNYSKKIIRQTAILYYIGAVRNNKFTPINSLVVTQKIKPVSKAKYYDIFKDENNEKYVINSLGASYFKDNKLDAQLRKVKKHLIIMLFQITQKRFFLTQKKQVSKGFKKIIEKQL